MLSFRVMPARQSGLSNIPFKAIYADYHGIGTHEHIRHPETVEALVEAMVSAVYQGPPLAVVEAGNRLGIADGHHRLQALKILRQRGLLRDPQVPVQVVPADRTDLVRLATMRSREEPLPLSAITACFTDPDAAIPPSGTTHFQARLNNGKWVRLAEAQPDIVITRDDLLHTRN